MQGLSTIKLSTMEEVAGWRGQPAPEVDCSEEYELVRAVGSAKWLRIGPSSAMVILDRAAGRETANDDLEQILADLARAGLTTPSDQPDVALNDVEIWFARPITRLPTPRGM